MTTTGGFDQRSLEKVLADLDRNLSKREMKKLLNKGSKAGAMIMKRAIIANAPVPAGRIVKIRALRSGRGGTLNGHHIYIGRGSQARGINPGGFDIPAIWAEWGTYNQRNLGNHPYAPATLKRHPDAYAKNDRYPPGYGIRPTHFIRRAFDANRAATGKAMFDAIEQGVKEFKVSK